ncbi:flavoprotein [Streptomyces sp. NPDC044780]|uniref:flavoprotein n=1 Tax=unclassified Streptomyces TaxID=2593676 RepID=UPI0033D5FD52
MPRPTPAPERRAALWAAAAAGIAGDVGKLITTAQERNRDVGVVATPQGLGFIDLQPVKAQTGYPIRSAWRSPGDPRPLPRRDAIAVAPATFNTINKWAAGTSDTLAVGILREAYGLGVPPKPGGGRDTFRWEQALELLSSKMR